MMGYALNLVARDCMMAALSNVKFSHDWPGSFTICTITQALILQHSMAREDPDSPFATSALLRTLPA